MAVRNCAEFVSVNGRTEPIHGATIDWATGGVPLKSVGRHSPGLVPPKNVGAGTGWLPSCARALMQLMAASWPTTTPASAGTQTIRREELLIFRLYEVVGGGPRESADEHVACSRRSRSDRRARRVRDGASVRFVTSLVGLDGIVHRNVDSSEIKEP